MSFLHFITPACSPDQYWGYPDALLSHLERLAVRLQAAAGGEQHQRPLELAVVIQRLRPGRHRSHTSGLLTNHMGWSSSIAQQYLVQDHFRALLSLCVVAAAEHAVGEVGQDAHVVRVHVVGCSKTYLPGYGEQLLPRVR